MTEDNLLKKGVHLKRSKYFSSDRKSQYIEYPRIDLYVEDEFSIPDKTGSVHCFYLENIEKTSDNLRIQEIIHRISNIEASEIEGNKPLYRILKDTVEGQKVLEYVVSKNTKWDSLLKLPIPENPRHISDLTVHNSQKDREVSGKWKTEDYLERKRKEDQVDIDITVPTDTCTYVIRLEDADGLEWLYVGKTSNIMSRLGNHIDKGGDSQSLNHKEMRLCEVEEVRPNGNEREHYLETLEKYDIPNKRITGGK